MHLEVLSSQTRNTLDKLRGVVHAHSFILAGGTALALQLGHRKSFDLDFFSDRPFSTEEIYSKLQQIKLSPSILQEEEGTLTVTADATKVSFFHYAYPFLDQKVKLNDVPVAGILDIASMKIIAISQRGAKRDFVDLFFILQSTPFWKIAENLTKRFGRDRINPVHIGKSLVYFNDAEADPEPVYCGKERPDWKDIKKFFKNNIRQIALDLQVSKPSFDTDFH